MSAVRSGTRTVPVCLTWQSGDATFEIEANVELTDATYHVGWKAIYRIETRGSGIWKHDPKVTERIPVKFESFADVFGVREVSSIDEALAAQAEP